MSDTPIKPYSICRKPDGTATTVPYDEPIPDGWEIEMNIVIPDYDPTKVKPKAKDLKAEVLAFPNRIARGAAR